MGFHPGKPGYPPEDEYDSEVQDIIDRMPCEPSVSEVHSVVYETFIRFFTIRDATGRHHAGDKARYRRVAERLHTYLSRD